VSSISLGSTLSLERKRLPGATPLPHHLKLATATMELDLDFVISDTASQLKK